MIKLKQDSDLPFLRKSGKILTSVLKKLRREAKIGISLNQLNNLAVQLIEKNGAKPSFLDYRPNGGEKAYPAALCCSVNEIIVHGLPSDYKLKEGDILKIDLGVNYCGYFTDAALTIGIGRISIEAEKLIGVTYHALDEAIKKCRTGNCLGDIGWAIESTVKKSGFAVLDGLTGHGTGFAVHEEPTVYNFGRPGEGLKLETGLILALEPMTSLGSSKVKQLTDESFATLDKSLSAHFEKTVYITEGEPEILTPYEL